MIAITGANGQLGRLVLKHLSRQNTPALRALVRSPEKAADLASTTVSIVHADYNAPETLAAALQGVDRLLLISGSEVGSRTRQHGNIIEAAKRAGVSFIVYTSLLNAGRSKMILAAEHVETEALLKASGIAHAILRNGWYLENYSGAVAAALAQGAVAGASGEGRISAASRQDYAEAAASVLTGQDTSTRVFELGGSGFTAAELAAEVSRQAGRTIAFRNMEQSAYAAALTAAGLPGGIANALADADAAAAHGALETSSDDLEQLIGHPPLPLAAFVQSALSQSAA
jgi:NAD(P)H dehydrogenase (quinone)